MVLGKNVKKTGFWNPKDLFVYLINKDTLLFSTINK